MELYTSLTRLKMAMNDGQLPLMTPFTHKALAICDPAFGIGMGAFAEDEEKGLRCPVRGCGRWVHSYRHHADAKHADIGGSAGVLTALDIPQKAVLYSARLRETRRASAGHLQRYRNPVAPGTKRPARIGRSISVARGLRKSTAASRNLLDRCEAQISHKLIDLQNRLGRSPSYGEVEQEYHGLAQYAVGIYGSWANVMDQFGLETRKVQRRRIRSERVLAGLRAWHNTHGSLPGQTDCIRRDRTPLLAAHTTHLRALGTTSWAEAMRRAASLLNIYGGRYGLPEKRNGTARLPLAREAERPRPRSPGEDRAENILVAGGSR